MTKESELSQKEIIQNAIKELQEELKDIEKKEKEKENEAKRIDVARADFIDASYKYLFALGRIPDNSKESIDKTKEVLTKTLQSYEKASSRENVSSLFDYFHFM